jgi:TFIIF-interacting CTD phosphatase-like protein
MARTKKIEPTLENNIIQKSELLEQQNDNNETSNIDTIITKSKRGRKPKNLLLKMNENTIENVTVSQSDNQVDKTENITLSNLEELNINIDSETTKEISNFNHKVTINHNGKTQTVWIIERPGLQSFLDDLHDKYEIILYTAGIRQYGIKVLMKIEKINVLLFKNHLECIILKDVMSIQVIEQYQI